MWVCIIVLICFVTSPAVCAVTKELINSCSASEFTCSDGTCISASLICDRNRDCPDGLDEALCNLEASLNVPAEDVVLHERIKRQSQCRRNEWQCRDGTCIAAEGKCDGEVNCPDRSDETHALCRKSKCQPNWFRCTYGACVDGTAPCNGIAECADKSDELLPKCRNESSQIRDKFRCEDGNTIPATDYCDGVPNCPDKSDETISACAARTCPSNLFQCAYGACVDQKADCNGRRECADGSDESDELCNEMPPPEVGQRVKKPVAVSGNCVLPEYPKHGTYLASNAPNASPGQSLPSLHLNYTCRPGYGVVDTNVVFCQDGTWSTSFPQCVPLCKLDKDKSVTYHCQVNGKIEGERACRAYEPTGTVVRPECNTPNYYSPTALPFMRCIEGSWSELARCVPECGRLTPEGTGLILGGRDILRGELPWHVGIYRKKFKKREPYEQICGGSLVSYTVVISAAHCFWTDVGKKQPASNYAVAIGKLYRTWFATNDTDEQKSDVKDIKIPARFQGGSANFQEDIALVILQTPFEYFNYVRPVCLDFDIRFSNRQLQDGKMGKVAGWGYTTEKGDASYILKVVELPYVNIEQCINVTPPDFREHITGDKICAGYFNGTALCRGDSGGGLAFYENERGVFRYYLRGIVSTAPKNDKLCNAFTLSTFTQIQSHEYFIKAFL